MLDNDIVTVPAGWYPDPMGLPQLRWWDNHAWTEFTSAARSPLIMQDEPKLAYADDDLPSRRSQREQRGRTRNDERTEQNGARHNGNTPADLVSTLRQLEPPKPQNVELSQPAPALAETVTFPEPERKAAADATYDPFAEFLTTPLRQHDEPARSATPQFAEPSSFEARDFAQQPTTGSFPQQGYTQQQAGRDARGDFAPAQSRIGIHAPLAYTPFVRIIAMIPLIQLVGILLVVSAVEVSMAMPFLAAIGLGPYAVSIPLAIADYRALLRAGHQHPASWAWSLLSAPAYLVARAIAASREYGKGLTPLLVWAALSLLQVVSVIAVPGILISAMPAVFSAEVESSLESDSIVSGAQLDVTCPDTPPIQIGGTFNCDGVMLSNGDTVGIVVRLQRANGWIDWRVYGMVWDKDQPVAALPFAPAPTPAS